MLSRKVQGGPLTPVYLSNAQITSTGEIWTTVTERENDVFAVYSETGIAATKYICVIDLDNPLWPHLKTGQGTDRVDITSIYYTSELSISASFAYQYGVISRIDNVNADIWYFTGITQLTGTAQEDRIVSLRGVPSQVKLDINGNGQLGHGITNIRETNVATVNTTVSLDSPAGAGTVTPAVGDVLLKIVRSTGTTNFTTFLFYHTHVAGY